MRGSSFVASEPVFVTSQWTLCAGRARGARGGEGDDDYHRAGVHEVTAEAAASALQERLRRCSGDVLTAFDALADRQEHLGEGDPRRVAAEAERRDGPRVARAEGETDQRDDEAADERRNERALHLLARGAAPWKRRTDAEEEDKRRADRNDHRVEVRTADAHLLAANRFDDEREDGADENREGEQDEEEVVDEEHPLAADRTFDASFGLEGIHADGEQGDGADEDGREEDEDRRTDAALRERVDGVEDTGARHEGAEDRQEEARLDQRDGPPLQDATTLHDDGAMQRGGRGEPRQ